MTAPEWQERSRDAATARVDLARERELAAEQQRVDDEQANAAGEPGGYGRAEPGQAEQGRDTSAQKGAKAAKTSPKTAKSSDSGSSSE